MPRDSQPSARSITASAVLFEGGLALVALVLGWLIGQPALASMQATPRGLLVGLAATVPLGAALVAIDFLPIPPLKQLDEFMRRSIVPLFRGCSLGDLLVISALAGLGEELLFRGVMQLGVERVSGSPWLALAAASLLFGLAHAITPTYAVVATLIGGYLGGLLLLTGNLWVPTVAHAAYDFFALTYLLRGTRGKPAAY